MDRAGARGWATVVSDICGLHAQVWSSAELALAARVDRLSRERVEKATWADRTLVKTWAMRGTLHLLPAGELPAYVAAQGALKPRWQQKSWQKAFGVSAAEAETLLEQIPAALAGEPLTRAQLGERVAGGAHAEQLADGFGALLKPAALHGELIFAPSEGRNVRFTRPDRWLKTWTPVSTEEGVAHVVRRYLAAYGPAPREQFARWFGTQAAPAGRMLATLGDELVETSHGWLLASDLDAVRAAEPAGVTRLLPGFDPYVVATPRDEPAVLEGQHKAAVHRPQGWISPVLVTDDVIGGTWSHELKQDVLTVEVTPFGRASKPVRTAVDAEADRLAGFLGAADVRVDWT